MDGLLSCHLYDQRTTIAGHIWYWNGIQYNNKTLSWAPTVWQVLWCTLGVWRTESQRWPPGAPSLQREDPQAKMCDMSVLTNRFALCLLWARHWAGHQEITGLQQQIHFFKSWYMWYVGEEADQNNYRSSSRTASVTGQWKWGLGDLRTCQGAFDWVRSQGRLSPAGLWKNPRDWLGKER